MITRTPIIGTNTIVNSSKENFGLNPICSLNYGKRISRILIKFDERKLKEQLKSGVYKDISKLKHYLKMTNCGTVDPRKFLERDATAEYLSQRHRAVSFDVIAFRIPKTWDTGDGFDNSTDTWFLGYKSVSTEGSTWENSMSGILWDTPGIYDNDFLAEEYNKWGNGEASVVIGRQHFDVGNENLNIDITDFVNSVLKNELENYGICLMFSPATEDIKSGEENYINFFGPETNTFFKPVIETRYDAQINDDRYKFHLKKTNKLYFYAVIGGEMTELDEIPVCSINGAEMPVFSPTKGVYYTEVKLNSNNAGKIQYDVWSNIKYQGEEFEDVEMQFNILPTENYFNFGGDIEQPKSLNPVISGINDDQKLYQGDKRRLTVVFRVPYTNSEYEIVDNAYYRIYVKDGNREIDVIDWDDIDIIGKTNLFTIDTSELVPQDYYVDIKVNLDGQTLIYKNKLHFRVVDNVTEIKR